MATVKIDGTCRDPFGLGGYDRFGPPVPAPTIDDHEQVYIFTDPLTLFLIGRADTDDRPMTVLWEQIGGPGVASLDSPNTTGVTVTFPEVPGTYTFRLTCTNCSGTGEAFTDVEVRRVYYKLNTTVDGWPWTDGVFTNFSPGEHSKGMAVWIQTSPTDRVLVRAFTPSELAAATVYTDPDTGFSGVDVDFTEDMKADAVTSLPGVQRSIFITLTNPSFEVPLNAGWTALGPQWAREFMNTSLVVSQTAGFMGSTLNFTTPYTMIKSWSQPGTLFMITLTDYRKIAIDIATQQPLLTN